MGYNLSTAEGQQARLDEINAKAKAEQKTYEWGNDYLYAILRGEAEYDPKLVKIAMKLIDFELAKKTAVALFDGGDIGSRLKAARKRREEGEAIQEKAIAEAQAAGDFEGAIAIARRSPAEFLLKEHWRQRGDSQLVEGKFVRRL